MKKLDRYPPGVGPDQWSVSDEFLALVAEDRARRQAIPPTRRWLLRPLRRLSLILSQMASRLETLPFPLQQSPSSNEPDSNDDLGTGATKNAAAKGSPGEPVFIGIRAEKDKDLGAPRAAIGDSESQNECQYPASAAGEPVSDRYIGPGFLCPTIRYSH
jgi:hypothetical protein